MHRADYLVIAGAIRTMTDDSARAMAAYALADACARINPRFSREKFLASCDVPIL